MRLSKHSKQVGGRRHAVALYQVGEGLDQVVTVRDAFLRGRRGEVRVEVRLPAGHVPGA